MRDDLYGSRHTYSYLALRNAVGLIGIFLPFALILGEIAFFDAVTLRNSISHYFHSDVRSVLVGSLCAVALFMFFYSGYDKWDNLAGHAAGFFAIGVAWFPVTDVGTIKVSGIIHFSSAIGFFACLAFFSLVLFTKKADNPTRRKLMRNTVYRVCGWTIILCLLSIALYKIITRGDDSRSSFVLWAESVALGAFGLSWITKGRTLLPDR